MNPTRNLGGVMNKYTYSMQFEKQKVSRRRNDLSTASATCGFFSFLFLMSSVSEYTTSTGTFIALGLATAFGLAAWAFGSRRGLRIRIDN